VPNVKKSAKLNTIIPSLKNTPDIENLNHFTEKKTFPDLLEFEKDR
jgi:hypothetical protein